MALFGSGRDISAFRHMNREVMKNIIDIQVDWYKLVLNNTDEDIYGESTSRSYMQPQRIYCHAEDQDQEYNSDVQGVEQEQTATFSFLRDDNVEDNSFIEVGDIIEWNNKFWELDTRVDNQMIAGKDPDTSKSVVGEFGSNWSYIFQGHQTRDTILNIVNIRVGDK